MPRGAASATAERSPQGQAQRARILAAATELIAVHGVRGMTMRQLAAACGLNIATLYHYFASKTDLIGAIVDGRHYDSGLRDLELPIDPRLPARARLEAFVAGFATQAMGELQLWRLLIGESLRGDAVALAESRRLSGTLETAIDRCLGRYIPELDDPSTPGRADAASVIAGQLLAMFLEEMLLGEDGRTGRVDRRAAATAAVVFPTPPSSPGPPS
jgi:AcrR family transcriptional regulator